MALALLEAIFNDSGSETQWISKSSRPMGVINQPSGQIKLTNVSLVRLKKGKKRFEVACYQNKVQDYRRGVETDLDEVLQINQVFLNVSKGQVASNEDLNGAFGTKEQEVVIKEILSRGEIQLSEKERQQMHGKITNELLTLVSAKCVNPNSKKRYPPTMIHKALAELKFNVVTNKPAKLQALEAIKLLVQRQIIPIARAKMRVKAVLPREGNAEAIAQAASLIAATEAAPESATTWMCTGLIDPMNYRELVTLCGKCGTLQVLDMAVLDDANQ